MISHLTEGFLLGIATGTTCLATCGPVYAPYLLQYERNIWRSLLALLEISIGRFFMYAVFGIAAGLAGASIADMNRELFTAIAYLLFSIFLLITTFRTNKRERCCQTGKWASFVDRPILLGFFTGINFCPSFLLAVTKAVDLSGPWAGLALFSSFFVGTTLFIMPLSFLGYFGIKKQIRLFARIAAVLVSAWFIGQSINMMIHMYKDKVEADSINPAHIVNVLDPLPTYIVTNDTIASLSLQKGLRTAKKQEVLFRSSESVPDSGIIFVGREAVDGTHLEQNPLRKKGRFLLILPDSSQRSLDTSEVRSLIDFLAVYSFKIDPDSGTVFQIPDNFSIKNLK